MYQNVDKFIVRFSFTVLQYISFFADFQQMRHCRLKLFLVLFYSNHCANAKAVILLLQGKFIPFAHFDQTEDVTNVIYNT